MMGDLPADRVQPARPFIISGVDFCGPVFTHFKIRGKQPRKAYIAVFCCFPTKAVHLELVSDLSTEGFLGALRRFISRRGNCKKIYCDNATNFVGARNQLSELKDLFNHENSKQTITSQCSAKGIEFKFIPPRAPHFGGLQYYPLTESELRTCVSMGDKYYCKQCHPLYKMGSPVSACEIRLLNGMGAMSSCQIVKADSQSNWIQMHSPNQWIYSLHEKTTVNVVCRENMSQLVLQDAGILKIDHDCIIKQPFITIQGHSIYPTINRLSYIPTLNLTDIVTSHNLTQTLQYQHNYSAHINELDAIKKQIYDFKANLPDVMRRHNIHHYATGYSTLAIIVVIIIFLIWKLRCSCPFSSPHQESRSVHAVSNHRKDNASDERFTINLDT